MKNKLKYIVSLILIIAFTAAGVVYASAEESTNYDQSKESPYADDNANYEQREDHEDEANFFEKVYEEIMAYTSEILCALTFAGSLVIAFAYKKGLLPLVEGSLITIGNAVAKIKESTNENTKLSSQLGENIGVKLSDTQELLTRLSERIGTLENTLSGNIKTENAARLEMGQLRLVVDTQIDMLYDIFMYSALPQYQKDAVGERIAKMKGAISENANEE